MKQLKCGDMSPWTKAIPQGWNNILDQLIRATHIWKVIDPIGWSILVDLYPRGKKSIHNCRSWSSKIRRLILSIIWAVGQSRLIVWLAMRLCASESNCNHCGVWARKACRSLKRSRIGMVSHFGRERLRGLCIGLDAPMVRAKWQWIYGYICFHLIWYSLTNIQSMHDA